MGIAPDILQNLSRSREGPLGIDDPVGGIGRSQIVTKGRRFMKVAVL
jgi:hypothetical protein